MGSYLCPDPAPQLSVGDPADKSSLAVCVWKPQSAQNAPGCVISPLVFAAGADGASQYIWGSLWTSDSAGAVSQLA